MRQHLPKHELFIVARERCGVAADAVAEHPVRPAVAVHGENVPAILRERERAPVVFELYGAEVDVAALHFLAALILPAARVVNKARGVEHFELVRHFQRVKLAPALVEHGPERDARAVIEMAHRVRHLAPEPRAGEHAAPAVGLCVPVRKIDNAERRQCGNVEKAVRLPAGYHVLPDDHAEPVAVIVPAQRLDFYVLAQHVEAAALHRFDVMYHRLVRGRREKPVRVIALIEQTVVEEGDVVQAEHLMAVVLDIRELAHGKIALHMVLAAGDVQRVEIRIVRRPGVETGERNDAHAALCPAPGDKRAVLAAHVACDGGTALAGGLQLNTHARVVKLRRDAQGHDMYLRHALEPDRLPDAALRGVPHAAALVALLAVGKGGVVGVVAHRHTKDVLPLAQQARDIRGKRPVPAGVLHGGNAVHEHLRDLIHRAEVQQHAVLPETVRQREAPAIMEKFVLCRTARGTGERRFRRKRHDDLAVPYLRLVAGRRNGVIPDAVEIVKALPPQLRAGIFR